MLPIELAPMTKFVMPEQKRVFALDVPGIHVLTASQQERRDDRDKPGHDEKRILFRSRAGE
jgi:hypothetical protein